MVKISELQHQRAEKYALARSMLDKADTEKRSLTPEEDVAYKALEDEIEALRLRIEREERLQALEMESVRGEKTTQGAAAEDDEQQANPPPKKVWRNLGEQLQAIFRADGPAGVVDPRLRITRDVPSGGSANVPSDGGWFIQHDFTNEIFKNALETGILASRCDVFTIGKNFNGLEVIDIDESSRATGSRWGGVRVYRGGEADAVSSSKPKLKKWKLELEDLKALAYATERLLEDAEVMSQVYTRAFSDEFAFVLDDEIMNGDGVGQCLGLVNAPALVTQAKETGQAAATIVFENITKMRSRLLARYRPNSAWFINQEIEPQLHTLGITVGTGGSAVFMPAGGIAGLPYDTIYGRPIIPIEQCAALGTVGDIVLADLMQYALIRKGGLNAATSMHVRFIYDEMCFRFKMRVNGAPKRSSALTPYKGNATLSSFVALATRA